LHELKILDYWSAGFVQQPEDGSDDIWLALDPKSQSLLRRRSVASSAIITEIDVLSPQQREGLSHRSAELMAWLRKNARFPEAKEWEWGVAETLLYFVFWSVQYNLWMLEILDSCNKKFDLKSILAFQPRPISARGLGASLVDGEDGVLGRLTEGFCLGNGLVYRPHMVSRSDGITADSTSLTSSIKDWVRRVGKKIPLVSRQKKIDEPYSLASTGMYGMAAFVQRMRRVGLLKKVYLLDGLTDGVFDGSLNNRWSATEISEKHPLLVSIAKRCDLLAEDVERAVDVFSSGGVCFAAEIAEKIKHGVKRSMLESVRNILALDGSLNKKTPQLFLSAGDLIEDFLIGAVCDKHSVPSVMLFHGALTLPKNAAEKGEIYQQSMGKYQSTYSHIAIPSQLQENHREMFGGNTQPLYTEPFTWGSRPINRSGESMALRQEIAGGKYSRVLLHASTPKGGPTPRFCTYETHNEYVRNIGEIAKAVEALEDVVLIVKFQPSDMISENVLREIVPFSDKIRLVIDRSFMDVLSVADLMISFATTAIEEALLHNIPVVFYGGQGRYQYLESPIYNTAAELPVSPIYAIADVNDLQSGIEDIFSLLPSINETHFDQFRLPKDKIEAIETILANLLQNEVD